MRKADRAKLTPLVRLLTCVLLVTAAATAQAASAFILGVPPIHSARVLTERFEPLRAYLEKQLGQPVRIESGADFRRFHKRTAARRFRSDHHPDALCPHRPTGRRFPAIGAVRARSRCLADACRRAAIEQRRRHCEASSLRSSTDSPSPSRRPCNYLATQGLEADRDYRIVEHRSHASAAYSLDWRPFRRRRDHQPGFEANTGRHTRQTVVAKAYRRHSRIRFDGQAWHGAIPRNRLKSILLAFPRQKRKASSS
jgi:hypothetical protein